jgi:thioredoxin 1
MLPKPVRELDDATFQDGINRGARPVLVDFWAPWCPPCRILAPTIEAIAEQFDGRADVAKLDIDRNPETAAANGIRSIPTVLIFRGARVVESIIGLQPRSRYERALDAAGLRKGSGVVVPGGIDSRPLLSGGRAARGRR